MAMFKKWFSRSRTEDDHTNSHISKKLRQAERSETDRVASLLLLGTGDSGKSTILKQIRKIHVKNITDNELRIHIDAVHTCTADSMRILATQSILYEKEGSEECKCAYPELRAKAAKLILPVNFTDEIGEMIYKLWTDDGIRATFLRRSEFQCIDTAPYFFEKARELSNQSYKVDFEDYIRIRTPTTGISHEEFTASMYNKPWVFQFTDVGGQRNERKKWIHVFDGVTAVIFVASLSEYDQKLYEDLRVNRMKECLDVFNNIVSTKTFKSTDFIVFFNKKDLFLQKIKETPFTEFVKGFKDPHNPEAVVQYLKEEFIYRFDAPGYARSISFYETQATDTNIITEVMDQVMVTVARSRLREVGMMR